MKEKRRDMDDTKITGFFDKDTRMEGDLAFKGSFRIDGFFKGTIKSDSVLIIGPNGEVDADVQIGHAVVDGQIKGSIQAKDKVEIHSTGRVTGTILAPKLVIEEGAFLEANCQTSDKPSPMLPEKKPETREAPGGGKVGSEVGKND
jgi:cytoskeletal protein CcmA (bactofilin family)